MKKYAQCVFLVVLFLAFLGCDIGFNHSSDSSPTNPPSTNPPSTGLPVKTIRWERGTDGFYQFYTNDQQYFSYGFPSNLFTNNPNIFEIEIKKISGARDLAYGMIFGAVDYDNNYFVNIAVDGYYVIGKRVNGSVITIQGWTDFFGLRTGFNVSNTIRVTKSGSYFQVSFNGSNATSFTDSSITGSGIGAVAWVGKSGEESFPNTPVEVKFRFTGQ
jgi:hypothetical protein